MNNGSIQKGEVMKPIKSISLTMLVVIRLLIASDGIISGVTYFDYSAGPDQSNGFEIRRSYFTYETEVSKGIKFKFQLDVGRQKNDDYNQQLYAYLKNAKVTWDGPVGRLTFGLQGMNVFDVQEKTWGYRFIEKSPMDLYRYASSADLGVGYAVTVGGWHGSLLVTNGGGYKRVESDPYKKVSGQIFYGKKKLSEAVGFNAGGVFTYEPTATDPRVIFGVFGGFAGDGLRWGAEWEQMQNGVQTPSRIIAVYGNYRLLEKLDLFGRWDQADEEWYTIAGINYRPGNGLEIAPNIRYTAQNGGNPELQYKVNFLFKF
jgi:hypothetical protein